MKNLFTPLLMATALIATACTNTNDIDTPDVDPSGKTPISFVGENSNAPITRAGFSANTQIAMHIRSTKDASNYKETRTIGLASTDAAQSTTSYSGVTPLNSDYVRYWDDAYGRDAKLSVFAIAVPGKTDATNGSDNKTLVDLLDGDNTWAENPDPALSEAISWVVSADQSGATTIADQDLTYSNNISANGKGGVYEYDYSLTEPDYKTETSNGEMKFQLKTTDANGPGKFNKGHLTFKHALSRITVNVIKGTSFGDGSFTFTSGNIAIAGVSTSGSLDIEGGSWTADAATTGITKMAEQTKTTGAAYTLMAQMLPGFVIDGTDTGVMSFTIENNRYNVTKAMMLKALNEGLNTSATSITMEQGKNYVFNLTVDKKAVDVSATLEPWVNVNANNQNMDNHHITVSVFKNTDSKATPSTSFDLYRLNDPSTDINTGESNSTNWNGDYTEKATISDADNDNIWSTNWYFENNKAFYHFRSVKSGTTVVSKDSENNDVVDYFEISSGAQDDDHDYRWGAPLKSGTTSPIAYEKDASVEKPGYTAVISPAIGSTGSAINLTEFHMMSNINVVLKTSTGNDKVDLTNSKVYITRFYPNGKVQMGNGLVLTTGSIENGEKIITATATTGEFTYAVVPQSLARGTNAADYVGLVIVTGDNNKYYVSKLSEISATSIGGSPNQSASALDFWYPNHSYTYTFTLTKKGIDNMECTVEKWIEVKAKETGVTLE